MKQYSLSHILSQTRSSLQGRWGQSALATAIYLMLISLHDSLLTPGMSLLLDWILAGPLLFGLSLFFLRGMRGTHGKMSDLFAGFTRFHRVFFTYLLMTMYTLLWSLLLIVPGLIAVYAYSMAYFVLIDAPHLSPSEVLRESRRIMVGQKFRLFLLQFRVIVRAALLGGVWFTLLFLARYYVAPQVPQEGLFLSGGFLFLLWLIPYSMSATACFYTTIMEGADGYGQSHGEDPLDESVLEYTL
ncbi:DUF975 family protein [Chitinivibrio alkaliphilus]|uniref:DUF975 family protein n=1 Tax=Chitinivibrio alkaliphilus ACht1 TaxID=1313304 RepID=U7D760_9BACT|nr:DUF975 family protein [Chitinivibrio alkaliphilus]ERP38775.1 hypothetical protein CALK_0798 [Chitinivibrio alkaliphilus ACht1]